MSRRPQTLFWPRILITAFVSSNTVWADIAGAIATDGTMGQIQTLSGDNVNIPQTLGTTVGNNLFHSFAEFTIATGQTVEFTGSNALQNVFSRVTGADATHIDGTLKSSIANAAFYFINPNGIIFGANAKVDVPGDFHVSTAAKISFADAIFYAGNSQTSTLSSEAPAAFGFLDTSAANNGLIAVNSAQLAVATGQTLDIVAGDIAFNNGATVSAPAGEIRLVATRGDNPVSLEQTNDGTLPLPIAPPSASHDGGLAVDTSMASVAGDGGGRIGLWGGHAVIGNSYMEADNTGTTDAGTTQGIDIRVAALTLDGSGIASSASSTGKGGNVTVDASDSVDIINGSIIGSDTLAQGDAGQVTLSTNALTIDGQGQLFAGIGSLSSADSSGQVGNVTINAGTLAILNGGVISSSTFGQGNAGNIAVFADSLAIDHFGFSSGITGILSQAESGSSGSAGDITISTGTLAVLNGGFISSATFSRGNAGNIAVLADSLTINGFGFASGATGITSQAALGSTGGHAGNVTVRAGTLDILDSGVISSDTLGQGNAGNATIEAGLITVLNNGFISSSTFAQGDAGSVRVTADALTVDGQAGTAGIASGAAVTSSGHAGNVSVKAGMLDVVDGGKIMSSTFSEGNAGSVAVSADALTIDSRGFSSWVTGILSQAEPGSTGAAGDVAIHAGTLVVVNGGEIASSTFAHGDAGSVSVSADTLTIDSHNFLDWATGILSQAEAISTGGHAGNLAIQAGQLGIFNGGVIASSTFAEGNAGSIAVSADMLTIDSQGFPSSPTGVFSQAEQGSSGHAGNLMIGSRMLAIVNGGSISSSTFSQGNAGNVAIMADALAIDGGQQNFAGIMSAAGPTSSGHAGNVAVQAGKLDIFNSGLISSDTFAQGDAGNLAIQAGTLVVSDNAFVSSSTFAQGNAGSVMIAADSVKVDGLARTSGIASGTGVGSSGQAGNVSLSVGMLELLNGGKILSSTQAQGSAGSVNVHAEKAAIFGGSSISSGSQGSGSSGKTGDVIVTANDWLHLSEGRISIENEADFAHDAASIRPGSILVSATDIAMKDSEITSHSTGNVAAGNISVNFSHQLMMEPSFISTTANTGNGGNIVINGGDLIYLQDSGFRTTVSGADSNGGDIFTKADILVMESGLIQANAVGGSGGNIALNLDALIPSGNTLLLGGATLAWQTSVPGFNVVQAASQAGVSGTVSVTAPQLNLSGIIANLGGAQFGSRTIGQDYCGLDNSSSLTRTGSGGLKPKSGEQLPF
ncbi:MAG: beta strand repeat-containing protein [Methylobacter sp.]